MRHAVVVADPGGWDGELRYFAGRLLVLSDGLGVALGAMAIYAPAGSTGVRPFG